MKRIYLLLAFLLIYISSFGQILTITPDGSGQSYVINGISSGNTLIASEVDDSTVRLYNVTHGNSNDYKTISSFSDFLINGVNPTSVSNAVELINIITKRTTADVSIQDQTTPIVIAKASIVNNLTALTNTVAIDDYTITVDDNTGFVDNSLITITNVANNRYSLFVQIGAPVGNVITIDSPIDFAFPSGSQVTSGSTNLAVNGSVTPVVFGLRTADPGLPVEVDITRIIFTCVTEELVDLTKFGDIVGGLTNGLVMRQRNGTYSNIFNAKTNGELASLMYDFTVYQKSNPQQGQDGFVSRLTFAGQSKVGVVIRVGQGEDIEFIVQDDLSSITSLIITLEGHVVENGIWFLLLFFRRKINYNQLN